MATVSRDLGSAAVRKLGVLRLAATGGLVAAVFFAVCWLGAFLPLGNVSHMYVQLFTAADVTSGLALVEGFVWSIVFGAIAVTLTAYSYNALAFLDR